MSQSPPSDVASERIVLGAMILDRGVIDDVVRRLTSAAFYEARHAAIFEAIAAAYDAGEPTDPVALSVRLQRSGDLPRIGGGPYLHDLMHAVPTAVQASWYAERVAVAAMARGLAVLADKARDYAHSLALEDPAAAISRVQEALDALGVAPDANDPTWWPDLADPAISAIEAASLPGGHTTALSTGLADLDLMLGGGLRPGQVVVIAGRPGMGKSILARNLIRAAALHAKQTTLLFTMEMTELEVFNCIASAELRINLAALNGGRLDDNDWARLAHFIGYTSETPLFIDDTAGISLAEIRTKARAIQKRHGLHLLVIDYLQLIDVGTSRENRQVAVAGLSRGLKVLAQQLGVPIVVCAQLNRGPEMRADKKPSLADLRESGAVENDANVVILVHRDEYYDPESPRRGEGDLIVAKNRSGHTGTITVAAQLHHSRFVSMEIQ